MTLPPLPEDFDPSKLPTGEDIAAAIDKAEQEEAQQKEWLASPEAVQERATSKNAYAGISAAEAEALLSSTFAEQLAFLNSDAARFLSDAQLLTPTEDETAATVKDEGNGLVMDSAIPVRTEDEQGELSKVDLSLKATAEGFETTNALIDVSIPDSAAEPVAVGKEGLAISQRGADAGSDARLFGDENVFMPEVLTDTDQLVSPIAGGVEIFNLLRSQESPETFRFDLGLPDGAELRADARGGAEVLRGKEPLAYVRPPVAVDAQGTDVPVELTVGGSSLVLRIDHRGGDYALPILLDPVLENAEEWTNGKNHDALSQWVFQGNVAGMYGSTERIETSFLPWNPRGLYVSGQPGTYWPQQFAQWSYGTLNANMYISSATLNPYWRNTPGGCGNPEPHDYFGLWNPQGWVPGHPTINSANYPGGSFSVYGAAQAVTFGLGSGNGPGTFTIGCWRDLYAGGAHVWLDDWANPYLNPPQVNGIPSGWVSSKASFTATANASDIGLGIQNVFIDPVTSPIIYDVPLQSQCAGNRRSPCATTHTAYFDLKGGDFDQGERTLKLGAYDPSGKYATSHSFPIKVDTTSPSVILSGQLATATNEGGSEEKPPGEGDELSLPVYNLTIAAVDGSNASPADKRSGVKSIEVRLDNKVVAEKVWTQAYEGPSKGMTQTYQLKLTGLSAREHSLRILAFDHAGNPPRERSIEFEYFPATGIDDDYAMHRFPLPDGQDHEGELVNHGPELAVNVMNGNLVYHQRDVDLEGYGVDLEVERYYNSQLPTAENTEWGDGWTLAQTPDLVPNKVGGSPVPNEAEMIDSSGAFEEGIELPTVAGTEHFDPELQATLEKQADGGYELTDATGETATSIAFDGGGQTEALLTEGAAKVDYDYEGGELTEIAVDDPASTTMLPDEVESSEGGGFPTYQSSFGTAGTANGQLDHPADVALTAQGDLWAVDMKNNRLQKFNAKGEYLAKFGTLGSGNGQLNRPTAVAIDAEGNLWVTDGDNDRIQRFNANGGFIAKFGSYGAGNLQFNDPEGIAVAPSGNIWVADTQNNRLQKLSSTGAFVKAVGSFGSGQGQLNEPAGIDLAPDGSVWVADWQNNRVVVFDENGGFVRQFGTEGTAPGQFVRPYAIDVDAKGNVWVGDKNNSRVELFDLEGTYVAQFGSAGSGPGQFSFGYPHGLAADEQGNLWIADSNNDRVQRWGSSPEPPEPPAAQQPPTYQSSFGTAGTGNGQLDHPADVAVTGEGTLLVVDSKNSRVQGFLANGQYIGQIGTLGSGNGQLNRPTAVAIDAGGNLWVTDADNDRIQKFNPAGQYLAKFGSYGAGNLQFNDPEGIAVAPNGNIWVADTQNNRLQKLSSTGAFVKAVGSFGSGQGQLNEPAGIDVAPDGDVWVADWQNNRVVVFDENGGFVRQFGTEGTAPGQFVRPYAIDVDAKGNVWVGDKNNSRVELFDLEGTYVAQFGSAGSGPGQFSFGYPHGVAADEQGNLWIADSNNDRVQRWRIPAEAHEEEGGEEEIGDDDPSVDIDTSAGVVTGLEGEEAGEHSYEHSGDDLVSHEGPEGETKYEYDTGGRMTKVTLPNATAATIAYTEDGRVKSVTVDPAGTPPAKLTKFEYSDEPRQTTVRPPDMPAIFYDIAGDGSIFKWRNALQPPLIEPINGTLYTNKETAAPISAGDHNLVAHAFSAEGIASIQVIANGSTVIDEKACPDPGNPCMEVESEWVVGTGDLAPGILQLEIVATDHIGQTSSKRFWVNIPYTPPPPPGAPAPPKFADVLRFREEHGLDIDLNPITEEIKLNDRVFESISAWHDPHSSLGQVARASYDRWGVPLRPVDIAELEWRIAYQAQAASAITTWAAAHPGSGYAGYLIDEAAGGLVRAGFTNNQASQVADLKSTGGLAAPTRVAAFSTVPTHSLGQLESLASQVEAFAATHPEVPITTTGLDMNGNRVSVGASNVAQAASSLTTAFGSGAPLVVSFARPPGPRAGRERISGPIRAGDKYAGDEHWEGFYCTAGFGAWDKGVKPGNGQPVVRYFMLAAGHCVYPEEIQRRRNNPVDDDTQRFGYTARRGYDDSPSTFDTDAAAVRLEGDARHLVPRHIYLPGNPEIPVRGVVPPRVGMWVCQSGVTSDKRLCGPITKLAVGIKYDGQRTLQVEYDVLNEGGDSGGPIWQMGTGNAVGLLTAGEEGPNGEETKPGYFTPLLPLLPGQPGVLGDPKLAPLNLFVAE